MLHPLEDFIHRQTTSGVLLMLCALLALIVANSPFSATLQHLLHLEFGIGLPDFKLNKSLHHWINDGLMTVFFLLVGLELKREILVGELNDRKKALLPAIAAFGGMLVPVLIYMLLNYQGHGFDGWGIPMATDIAFALGALALLGNRVPKGLLMFLVALAIVDDLGAVIIIALFYTETLNGAALAMVGITLALLIAINLGGIRKPLPYLLLGLLLWLSMLNSGIHATLAGVLLAFTIPMRPKYDAKRFIAHSKGLLDQIEQSYQRDNNIVNNEDLRAKVKALGNGVHLVQAPAQILESKLHLPSAYLVIPIFAFANAGIAIDFSDSTMLSNAVFNGVVLGLVLGKLVGVAGFTWLAVRMGFTQLPSGVEFKHIIGAAFFAGIGFTMSIFIAELGFAHLPEELLMAKAGVLAASVISGVLGFLWLLLCCKPPSANSV